MPDDPITSDLLRHLGYHPLLRAVDNYGIIRMVVMPMPDDSITSDHHPLLWAVDYSKALSLRHLDYHPLLCAVDNYGIIMQVVMPVYYDSITPDHHPLY